MKILLISIGTRGDMEPFLAIGEILQEKGHEVLYLFPEQFRGLVEDSGAQFEGLGSAFIEMLESDLGKFAMGGAGPWWKKFGAYVKLARMQGDINRHMMERQQQVVAEFQPDRIVHNGKAMYPVIWEVEHPGSTTFVSPVPFLHYVKGHTHVAFHSNYGSFLNKLTFRLADWGLVKTIMASLKWVNQTDISKKEIKKALDSHQVIYTISPQLFERPNYWPENIKVLGYHERDKTVNWQPSPGLLAFLERHEKILFVTFGSMINPEPVKKTEIILDILQQHQIPALFNTSAGGLVEPTDYDHDLFHFVSSIPYEWLLPKVYAVMHHGGSGTTHLTLRHGCASLILPHIIDQFAWDQMLSAKGVGPSGIKVGRISIKSLTPKLLDLFYNEAYKRKAEEMADKMRSEEVLREKLYQNIVRKPVGHDQE